MNRKVRFVVLFILVPVLLLGGIFSVLISRLISRLEIALENRFGVQIVVDTLGWNPLAGWTVDRVQVEHPRGTAELWDLEFRVSGRGLWNLFASSESGDSPVTSPLSSLRVGTFSFSLSGPSQSTASDFSVLGISRSSGLGLIPESIELGPGQVALDGTSFLLSISALVFVRNASFWNMEADFGTLGGWGHVAVSGKDSLLGFEKIGFSGSQFLFSALEPLRSLGYVPTWTGYLTEGQGAIDVDATLGAGGRWDFFGNFELADLVIDWPVFSSSPIDFLGVEYSFAGFFDPLGVIGEPQIVPTPDPPGNRRGVLSLTQGSLRLGEVTGEFRPSLFGVFGEPKRIKMLIDIPRTPLQDILESVPPSVAADFSAMELGGYFSWELEAEIPLDRLSHMQWISNPKVEDFTILSFPRRYSPFGLNQEFDFILDVPEGQSPLVLKVDPFIPIDREELAALAEQIPSRLEMRNQQLHSQRSFPHRFYGDQNTRFLGGEDENEENLEYTPLSAMGQWLPRAVLTGEDGDFFFHSGIDWNTFRSAIERNLRTGEVEFGASTVSMQLVKNLFLVQDQELVRKIQEAFLVYLLEHRAGISKERILELYLNIAPFGPRVYGAREGARYYFNKDPGELTIPEALWMASMLPSPIRYSQFIRDGKPADYWLPRLRFLLDIMLERQRISPQEYEDSRLGELSFTPIEQNLLGGFGR